MVACTNVSNPAPIPSPTSAAHTSAADMRTRMELLMSEQVMIVAKESAAAVNHSDEYAAYATLLGLNAADLSALVARAFGNTAGGQFMNAWSTQDGLLVDYAIGVVTHNDDKANKAIEDFKSSFIPQFTQLLTSLAHLPADFVTADLNLEVADVRSMIDDYFAANFAAYFSDLHRAYLQTANLAGAFAQQIANMFPDKFPGDPNAAAVSRRVIVSLGMQAQSYLETIETDAALNSRDAEKAQALAAMSTNLGPASSLVEDPRFGLEWSREGTAISSYAASQDPAARSELTDSFPTQMAAIIRAPVPVIANHEKASIRVVDDQRSKSQSVANDDRAAATSMQPIADALS